MTTYFGLNTSGVSTLFSSLSSSTSGSTTSSLLSDYASIKSGSYYKLLKAYYAQSSDSSTTASSTVKETSDNTAWKEAASDISSLKSSANSLTSADYSEGNRSKIEKSVSEFVSNYNATLDSASDVSSSSLASKTKWMTRITSTNEETLKKVGITVNSDQSLSLDKDTLSAASLDELKSAFSGSYSYADQINSATTLMAQVASNGGASTTASLYTSSGSYSNLSTSSLYDYLF